ncbi:MAG: hypothetical protein IJ679_05485 [Lachnospiraceae bacterium]|nr:hypothetical protein [Lachnospiraceae bacterium]
MIGNAGKATLTNVIARNDYKDSYTLNPTQYDIKAVSEHAGGLIGNVGNGSQINYCAAALTVSGGTSAGGLIGNASGATIRGCYAAGHTEQGEYYTHETSDSGNGTRDEAVYNVKGSTAGGLVGILSSGSIDKSYSTCSVEGSTAGGFVGSADGSITTCYCTGLVSGTGNNAFIGDGTPSGLSGNYYYSVINEIASSETSTGENTGSAETTTISTVSYKKPMESETTGVVALDETVESYKAFIKIGGIESTPAEPYDSALKGRSYGLKGIKQLDASAKGDIINHYGDWPTPEAKEISVVNFVNTK